MLFTKFVPAVVWMSVKIGSTLPVTTFVSTVKERFCIVGRLWVILTLDSNKPRSIQNTFK